MCASYNMRNSVRKFDVRKWQMRKFNVRKRILPSTSIHAQWYIVYWYWYLDKAKHIIRLFGLLVKYEFKKLYNKDIILYEMQN